MAVNDIILYKKDAEGKFVEYIVQPIGSGNIVFDSKLSKFTDSETEPLSPNIGDKWANSATAYLKEYCGAYGWVIIGNL